MSLEGQSKGGEVGFRLGGFHFSAAGNDRMIDDVFRLWVQSYIQDYRMAAAADFPDQKHTDPYDAHALHALARDNKGIAVGTVRMVLNSEVGFQCLDVASPEHRAVHLTRFQEMERSLFDFNRIRAVVIDLNNLKQNPL